MVTQKVFLLQFPIQAFPRYKYTIDIVTKFNKRCQKLFQACGLSDKTIPVFKEVIIRKFVVGNEREDYIEEREMMFKEVDDFKNLGEVSENEESRAPVENEMFVINVASVSAWTHAHIDMTHGPHWILVQEEDVVDKNPTRFNDVITYYTTRQNIAKNLCNLLELHVFRSLKERVHVLRALSAVPEHSHELETLSEDQIPPDIKRYFKRLLEKYQKINTSVDTTSKNQAIRRSTNRPMERQKSDFQMDDLAYELRGLDINDANQAGVAGASKDLDPIMKIEKHLNIVEDSELQRKIADLDGEAQAMYKRSNVPESERPDIHLTFKHTREEIPTDIFKGIPEATSCGYRYGVFVVYVKASNSTPAETLRNKVRSILLRHGVSKFEVFECKDKHKLFCRHSVGNTVNSNGRIGTLGGFATMSNQLHIMSAKHVIKNGRDISVSADDKSVSYIIARVRTAIQPLPEGSPVLDIAVAKVDTDHTRNCESRFKDKDGSPQASVLYQGSDQIRVLEGLDVFIWGAMSRPGTGKITMPEGFHRAADGRMETYIVIEDEEDAEAVFCQEGDSGAIICADDPDGRHVNVISMLIGQWLTRASSNVNSYMSFQLLAGLQQLKLEYGGEFIIC